MNLTPFTRYNCDQCPSSRWTGAYTNPRPDDDRCYCGGAMVEELSNGRWRVSWEAVSAITFPDLYDFRTERARSDIDPASLDESHWHPTSRETDSESSARDQYKGLLQLAAEGEFIRNVRLEHAPASEWSESS